MSDFKHSLSYYKDMVERAKTTVRRVSVPPKSLSLAYSVEPFDQKVKEAIADEIFNLSKETRESVLTAAKTKARVKLIIRDHDAVLRALKNR